MRLSRFDDWLFAVAPALRLRLALTDPIFVFQMGKVGSCSIRDSLRSAGVRPVFHAHSLGSSEALPERRAIYSHIQRGRPVRVVTLVREPVGRNVSAFFENLDRYAPGPHDASSGGLRRLRDAFLDGFPHDSALNWFDQEFRPLFDIDVYAQPFPAHGALVLRKAMARVLLLRSELDDAIKAREIGAFGGLRRFVVTRTNVGTEKAYADIYRAFRGSVRLPAEYVERLCTHRHTRHFYSPAETAVIRSSWIEPHR